MKTVIVFPAYNAEKTLEKTFGTIPRSPDQSFLLVDDRSTDNTYELALRLGIPAVRHEKNTGYGGNQKTCYAKALEMGADIVVMLHPDYQYDPRVVPYLCGLIENDICDVVLGCRIRTRKEALAGGMPFYKYLANRFLTLLSNLVMGENLGEWHSGMRAYSRKVLETINWENNSDDFVFDTQFLVECVSAGFRIGDIPVPAKYFEEASSINFSRSMTYGLATLYVIFRQVLHRWGLFGYDLLKRRETK
ncbi:MAG: glycosyl transferase family 2 [Elusimicrobia bacterium RIFOXYA12_FULL_51_18]|nr:MAG: glycosyl transferase family 2 [Elusimicrobia bacterium RIFOXYA12_FULL_51_18]OGS32900.1 MAG: glycosyl transferase family 2 [Elusimicrobia bacterium RIFOXYA2_FULL_53_38]